MNRAYDSVRLSELRANFWSFSIKRASLAASTTAPLFGKANYFPLPADFLMLAPPDQDTNVPFGGVGVASGNGANTQYSDWQIESMPDGTNAIASNDPTPLYIRYVSSDVLEGAFDPSFAESLAASLAVETCEELTQSNTKLQNLSAIYKNAIESAKKRNAFEMKPVRPPVDPWILARM